MRNIIDYSTLNVHPGVFSLDKFIETDAPGTLSWLNKDEDDLNSNVLRSEEVERSSVVLPRASMNNQWLRLSVSLRSVQTSQLKLSAR